MDGVSEAEQTWKKIESVSRQTGLREGISDGRDSNFQESFDIGFAEGFKNGYILGKLKGITQFHEIKTREVNVELNGFSQLEKISRGACVACEEPSLLENDIEEVKNKQETIYNKNEILLRHLEETNVNEKS